MINMVLDIIMKYIDGFIKPQSITKDYAIVPSNVNQNRQSVVFSTEPSNVRLTPVLSPYEYNNTVNGIQFNSQ